MNLQTNSGQQVALTGCWRSQETPAHCTVNRFTGSGRPRSARLKMLIWLTIWFWVKDIRRERSVISRAMKIFG